MLSFIFLSSLLGLAQAAYVLQDNYNATNFFDKFDFWTAPDPTNGAVQYEDRQVAEQYHLTAIKASSLPQAEIADSVYFAAHDGVFDTSLSVSTSRPSVRLSSQTNYTRGLFVADIAHLPVAECGAWPAFWTTSTSSWPNDGEIDIVEGVNQQVTNQISLHTGDNCSMNQASNGSIGTLGSTDCASATNPAGCSLTDKSPGSYGEPFNAGQGGVYAMEWTSQAISVWWWARRDIPADVRSGAPQPATWATPVARFQGSCDIDSHFKDHQIIFDITFCGGWAGQAAVWGDSCAAKYGSSCSAYVMGSTDGFKQAYWEIQSVKVYQDV